MSSYAKNFLLGVLFTIAICSCTYIIFDQFTSNEESNPIEDSKQNEFNLNNFNNSDVKYVGVAYSNYSLQDNSDYKETFGDIQLVHKIDIPKIMIKTETTDKMNEEIYNKYIEKYNSGLSSFKPFRVIYDYDYVVIDNVLYINIVTTSVGFNAGGGLETEVYYYDIENDKQLTVQDIMSKYNISIDSIKQENPAAKEIYNIFPQISFDKSFDLYYSEDDTCPSFQCRDIKNITIE